MKYRMNGNVLEWFDKEPCLGRAVAGWRPVLCQNDRGNPRSECFAGCSGFEFVRDIWEDVPNDPDNGRLMEQVILTCGTGRTINLEADT